MLLAVGETKDLFAYTETSVEEGEEGRDPWSPFVPSRSLKTGTVGPVSGAGEGSQDGIPTPGPVGSSL